MSVRKVGNVVILAFVSGGRGVFYGMSGTDIIAPQTYSAAVAPRRGYMARYRLM